MMASNTVKLSDHKQLSTQQSRFNPNTMNQNSNTRICGSTTIKPIKTFTGKFISNCFKKFV